MGTTTEPTTIRPATWLSAGDDDARCVACAETFASADGWQGLCPSCGTLLDEHAAGRHDVGRGGASVTACLGCLSDLAVHDGRGRLTA